MHNPNHYKYLVAAGNVQLDIFGEQFDFQSFTIVSEECDDITAIQCVTHLLASLNIDATAHLNVNHYPNKDLIENHPVYEDYVPEMACMFLDVEDNIVGKILSSIPIPQMVDTLAMQPHERQYKGVYH